MLDSIEEHEVHDYTNTWFIGTVVATDKDAPDGKLERVKAIIPGLFEGDISTLPWITKATGGGYPNAKDGAFGSCEVPPIGSLVWVQLQEGDPHYPAYVGFPQSSASMVAIFLTSYPNKRGYKDAAGNIFVVDSTSGSQTFDYTHKSGTHFHIADDGSLTVSVVKDTTISTQGSTNILSGDSTTLTTPTLLIHGNTIFNGTMIANGHKIDETHTHYDPESSDPLTGVVT
jgi:hypothetical protein